MNMIGKAWLAFWVSIFLFLFSQVVLTDIPTNNFRALDFRMRYNEAECIRSGVDPYLVWNGTLPAGKYTPWNFKYLMSADRLNLVHAYPPWEYAWMLPLTCMSRDTAEVVFRVLSWGGVLFIVGCSFFLGYMARRAIWSGFAVATAVLLVWPAIRCCLEFLNFGILITTAVLIALLCHRWRHDYLAGLFWAFAMVKPQIGGLFIIALLVRWKWKTLLVTGAITLLGTLVSAVFCQRSPIDMVLSVAHYSHGQFMSVGLIQRRLFIILESSFGESVVIVGSTILGIMLCVLLSWMLRSCKDVFEWGVPPAFLSTVWVVARPHDQTITMIAILGLALSAVKDTKLLPFLCDLSLLLLVLLRDLDDILLFPIRLTQVCALILLFVRIMHKMHDLKNISDSPCAPSSAFATTYADER